MLTMSPVSKASSKISALLALVYLVHIERVLELVTSYLLFSTALFVCRAVTLSFLFR